MGAATFIHNLYTHYEKQCNLLFGTLQASTSLCKHSQKAEEAHTKNTISTHNWRVSKELAVFEGAQSFSSNNIENLLKCCMIIFTHTCFTLQLPTSFFAVPVTQKLMNENTNSQNLV